MSARPLPANVAGKILATVARLSAGRSLADHGSKAQPVVPVRPAVVRRGAHRVGQVQAVLVDRVAAAVVVEVAG